jgi:hypothetical protein
VSDAVEINRGHALPRRSATSLSVVSLDAARSARLRPPTSLTKVEQSIFSELAANAPHLRAADVMLLASLAQATNLSRRTARDPSKAAVWERATRMQMALARSLRMTPQSRIDARAAGRQQPLSESYYDLMESEDADPSSSG